MTAKGSEKGFSHILIIIGVVLVLLVVVAFVSGVADFEFDVSRNDKQDQEETSMIPEEPPVVEEVAQPKTYQNDTYGLTLEYPGNWTLQEGSTSDPLVTFLSQRKGVSDQFVENVNISVSDLSSVSDLVLSEVMDLWISQNESDPSFDFFNIVERTSVTISGFDTEQIIFETAAQNITIRGQVNIFLKGSDAYIFSYTAQQESYETFLEDVNMIFDTAVLE